MAVELEEPFATVEDLQAWWPDMPPGSEEHAEKLLLAASQFIVNANGGEVPEVASITLEQVTTNMVRRVLQTPDDQPDNLSSQMQVAGPYTVQRAFRDTGGNLYLTRQEKDQLGIRKQKAFEIDLLAGSRRVHEATE